MEQPTLSVAERHYASHLKSVSNYEKRNPEKIKEKCKRYIDRVKQDPEKYQRLLQQRKDYYNNVVKPKKELLKSNSLINIVEENI